jgi:hypothetical protein
MQAPHRHGQTYWQPWDAHAGQTAHGDAYGGHGEGAPEGVCPPRLLAIVDLPTSCGAAPIRTLGLVAVAFSLSQQLVTIACHNSVSQWLVALACSSALRIRRHALALHTCSCCYLFLRMLEGARYMMNCDHLRGRCLCVATTTCFSQHWGIKRWRVNCTEVPGSGDLDCGGVVTWSKEKPPAVTTKPQVISNFFGRPAYHLYASTHLALEPGLTPNGVLARGWLLGELYHRSLASEEPAF